MVSPNPKDGTQTITDSTATTFSGSFQPLYKKVTHFKFSRQQKKLIKKIMEDSRLTEGQKKHRIKILKKQNEIKK